MPICSELRIPKILQISVNSSKIKKKASICVCPLSPRAYISVASFQEWKQANESWRGKKCFLNHLFRIFTSSEEEFWFPYEHLAICFKKIQIMVFNDRALFASHTHLTAYCKQKKNPSLWAWWMHRINTLYAIKVYKTFF